MLSGLLISSFINDHMSGSMISIGCSLTNLILSGVMWPLEGMPVLFRTVCGYLPQAHAGKALRNVFTRGWDIDRPQVYLGLVNNGCWSLFCIVCIFFVLRFKNYMG